MTGGWVGRNQERKKNRNRRKELTGTAYQQSHYDVPMLIPPPMGFDVILCLYSVLLPSCVDLDCARAVGLIIKPADHSVGDWCRRR